MVRDTTRGQFRVTAWPGLIPLPSYPRYHYVLEEVGSNGAGLLLRADRTAAPTRSRGETYLKLLYVDLADSAKILDFANEFGSLRMAQCWPPGAKHLLFARRELADRRLPFGEWWETINNRLEHQRLEVTDYEGRASERVPDFAFGAHCVRDLVQAWRVLNEQLDPADLTWSAIPPPDEAEAALFLQLALQAGLETFHPEVDISARRYKDDTEQVVLSEVGPWADGPPPFYAIACLELYNHIAEGAKYQHCANETCRKLFVRQEGRAQHEQYRRRGVLYCRKSCATAQAKRAQRQREKLRKDAS
jgi:hypothetical protein